MSLAIALLIAAQQPTNLYDMTRAQPVVAARWDYERIDAVESRATLGSLAVLHCNRTTRMMTLELTGLLADEGMSIVGTSEGMVTLEDGNRFSAWSPVADLIAFSRGRFVVTQGARAPIVMPSRPEVARVIEDCRV
ncbi:hypothetical protein [Sphingomicrobium sediminis]|uniref:Uncharacterized protein n=1 Tax=Sphingomicrobium sediminis TaxID=2950949 RepID=A0A9X2EKW1_9SPHN|nr:hypothetical protein [Sphingomicrobium sediminis]MCM8557219.1 hypothetical protein [Sphingomicrobium sediminis]